ncbi:porin [Lacunimicrobium album]
MLIRLLLLAIVIVPTLNVRAQELESAPSVAASTSVDLDTPPSPAAPSVLQVEEAHDDLLQEVIKRLESTENRVFELETELDDAQKKAAQKKVEDATKPKKWYDKYKIQGYVQLRSNSTAHMEEGSFPAQEVGDSGVGENQTFTLRRARLRLSGDVTDHMSIYFQSDFASTPPNSTDGNLFGQIRDFYTDLYLDDDREYRFRLGQSKVPYGWENLQSSSNRLPLDRADGTNSAFRNERDLGVMFYYTPVSVQEIFEYIEDNNLKGSGNYGMLGFAVVNGQGGSLLETNDNFHVMARATLPFWLNDCQLVEVSMQGYTGKYTVGSAPISPLGIGSAVRPSGTAEMGVPEGLTDERLAWTLVYYPQPLGFQAEWTIGRGPKLNADQTAVEVSSLTGGYAQLFYRIQTDRWGEFWPFARYSFFDGGYKTQRNAPDVYISEWELGNEWQINKYLELVTMITITDRTNVSARPTANTLSYGQFEGVLLRSQVQFSY